MKRLTWMLLAAVVACDSSPMAPEVGPSGSMQTAEFAATRAPVLGIVIAPQRVTLYVGGEASEEARVTGHLLPRDEPGSPQMDGAILVVSAADGPIPQPASDGVLFRFAATLEPNGLIILRGNATQFGERGEKASFPITGTARPMANNTDCLIFDILGGDVYDDGLVFEVDVRFTHPEPSTRE